MTTTTPNEPTNNEVAVNDIGSTEELLAAVDETIKYFDDGDIVEGTVVKVDRDEVLLDIGYKTEGVILSRELSIKHDVDPEEIVAVGDEIEALVLQKGGQGSRRAAIQEACTVRARLGSDRKDQGRRRCCHR